MDGLTTPRIVLLALSCLATSAAGGFLGGTLVQQPVIPPMPPPVPEPDPTHAIAEVGARVDALGAELRQALGSLGAGRDGGTECDTRSAARNDNGRPAPDAAGAGSAEVTPREILSTPPQIGPVTLWNRIASWPLERWDEERDRFREEFLLWSMHEILRAYGRPGYIESSSGGKIYLHYPQPNSGVQATFEICDGLVTSVSVDL